ncbi:MAG: hypothetical protein ACXQT3_01550 [Methermicoccaceae archaeon]
MKNVMTPPHAFYAVVEVDEDDCITTVGTYNREYLERLLKMCEELDGCLDHVEVAALRRGRNDTVLLLRPRGTLGEGWLALAPCIEGGEEADE